MLLAECLSGNRELHGAGFNFSDERQITVLELVEKILQRMESPLDPDVRNEASNEIRRQCLSAKRAREVLGWSPVFTLEEGLDRTIRWYKDFLR
jgi:CDP-glucose 4,6-dehydratase